IRVGKNPQLSDDGIRGNLPLRYDDASDAGVGAKSDQRSECRLVLWQWYLSGPHFPEHWEKGPGIGRCVCRHGAGAASFEAQFGGRFLGSPNGGLYSRVWANGAGRAVSITGLTRT